MCGIRIFYFFLIIISLSACSPQPNKLAKVWPSIDEQEQQARAILAASESLAKLDSPQVLIQIDQQDINDLLIPTLQERLKNLEIDNTDQVSISNIKLKLDNQLLQIKADFKMDVTEPDYQFEGHLSMVAAVAVQGDQLSVFPVLNSIVLEDVDRSEIKIRWADFKKPKELWEKFKIKFGNKIAVKIANAIFKHTMKVVNQIAFKEPININVDVGMIKGIDLAKMVKQGQSDKVSYSLTTPQVQATTQAHLGQAAVHISPDRLSVIADIDWKINTSNAALENLASESNNKAASSGYDSLTAQYQALISERFDSVAQTSSIQIRKNLIANIINEALITLKEQNSDEGLFILSATHQPVSDTISDSVQLWKKEHVNCESKRKSCQNTKSCAAKDCHKKSCARDCSRFDIICKGKAEACRAKEDVEYHACRVSRAAEAEACRVAARVEAEACRAGQDLEVANCKTKLEALRVVEDFLDVAEYSVTAGAETSRGSAIITDIRLSENLDQVQVKGALDISVPVYANIHLNPEGVGHLACLWKANPSITAVASAKQSIDITGTVTAQEKDNQLVVQALIRSEPVTVNIKPNPWTQISTNDSFLLSCTVLGVAMQTARVAEFVKPNIFKPKLREIMSGRFKFEGLDTQLEKEIGTVKISTQGISKEYHPNWGEKSIGFRRQ